MTSFTQGADTAPLHRQERAEHDEAKLVFGRFGTSEVRPVAAPMAPWTDEAVARFFSADRVRG